MQLQQSQGEILQVWTDWKTYHAPKNLIDNEQTASLMADFIANNFGGLVSRTSLDAAVTALASLVLKLGPTAEELAKKAEARMKRDYLDSIAPQTVDVVAKMKSKVADEAAEKQRLQLESAIKSAIDGYIKNGNRPGTVDYAGTEAFRDRLRAIQISSGGKRDPRATLIAVGACILEEKILPSEALLARVREARR